MAEALDGWDYCVMLADRDARIVATRWGCPRMRTEFELLGEALHGTLFREETTGTNSIATSYERHFSGQHRCRRTPRRRRSCAHPRHRHGGRR